MPDDDQPREHRTPTDIGKTLDSIHDLVKKAAADSSIARAESEATAAKILDLELYVKGNPDDRLRGTHPGLLVEVAALTRRMGDHEMDHASTKAVTRAAWALVATFGPGMIAMTIALLRGGVG